MCARMIQNFAFPSAVRRVADVLLAAALLPLAVPLCIVLLIAIRSESRGSPLFVQSRIGKGERPFKMLKLRTMRVNTEELPSHEVGDRQITRVGGVLRKLKLDELPQLANVLAGSMSLIGPRPCLPQQHELIEARRRLGLFALPPGVTGPAQILGLDMSQPQRLAEVEADYFRSRSLAKDLLLVAHTLAGAGSGDAANRSVQASSAPARSASAGPEDGP